MLPRLSPHPSKDLPRQPRRGQWQLLYVLLDQVVLQQHLLRLLIKVGGAVVRVKDAAPEELLWDKRDMPIRRQQQMSTAHVTTNSTYLADPSLRGDPTKLLVVKLLKLHCTPACTCMSGFVVIPPHPKL